MAKVDETHRREQRQLMLELLSAYGVSIASVEGMSNAELLAKLDKVICGGN